MRRRLHTLASGFFVTAAVVLARAAEASPPIGSLWPLLAVALSVSIVVGLLALATGRYSVVVAASIAGLVALPRLSVALIVLVAAVAVVGGHILGRDWDLSGLTLAVTAAVAVAGVIQVAQAVELSAPVVEPVGGDPVYLVLLDGYPRADTLAGWGIDISAFVDALEERGFDHYPDATSTHGYTHDTLNALFTGTSDGIGWATLDERMRLRDGWALPDGFVAVAPPWAHVTVPNTPVVGGGGMSELAVTLLGDSALSRVPGVGDLMMDGLRSRLDSQLDTLAATDERRVWAHLAAPHAPYLYGPDGEPLPPPGCWPNCGLYDSAVVGDKIGGIAGTVEYLNVRLLAVVDTIIRRDAAATIVLFSDHGARITEQETDEWHRTFLAARTPGRPGFFAAGPHPEKVLDVVAG